jgi:hypothetical protein
MPRPRRPTNRGEHPRRSHHLEPAAAPPTPTACRWLQRPPLESRLGGVEVGDRVDDRPRHAEQLDKHFADGILILDDEDGGAGRFLHTTVHGETRATVDVVIQRMTAQHLAQPVPLRRRRDEDYFSVRIGGRTSGYRTSTVCAIRFNFSSSVERAMPSSWAACTLFPSVACSAVVMARCSASGVQADPTGRRARAAAGRDGVARSVSLRPALRRARGCSSTPARCLATRSARWREARRETPGRRAARKRS